jgi:hypothetical protein
MQYLDQNTSSLWDSNSLTIIVRAREFFFEFNFLGSDRDLKCFEASNFIISLLINNKNVLWTSNLPTNVISNYHMQKLMPEYYYRINNCQVQFSKSIGVTTHNTTPVY